MKTNVLQFRFARTLGVLVILATLFSCTHKYIAEEDESGPVIGIIKPLTDNAIFYTDGGIDSPDFIVFDATATDESTITEGSITIYNSSGVSVHFYDYLEGAKNATTKKIFTSFNTVTPGDYTVEIMFKDAADNVSTVTKNITCIYSELPGDTDSN